MQAWPATQTYSSFDRRRQTSSSSLWLHQLLDSCISDCVTSAPETVSIELVVVVQLKSSNGTCSNQPIHIHFNSMHTSSWQELKEQVNKWSTSTDATKYSDDWLKALIWGNILLVLKQRPKTRLLIMKGYVYHIYMYSCRWSFQNIGWSRLDFLFTSSISHLTRSRNLQATTCASSASLCTT